MRDRRDRVLKIAARKRHVRVGAVPGVRAFGAGALEHARVPGEEAARVLHVPDDEIGILLVLRGRPLHDEAALAVEARDDLRSRVVDARDDVRDHVGRVIGNAYRAGGRGKGYRSLETDLLARRELIRAGHAIDIR